MSLRLGVTHKLWLWMIAVILVVLVPVGVALDRGVSGFFYAQNSDEMVALGSRLATFLGRAPEVGAEEAVRAIAEIAGTPLLILDEQGVVKAGTGPLAGELGRKLDTVQIQQALQGSASVALAKDQTLPGSIFVAAVPVLPSERADAFLAQGGVVLLFRPASEVGAALLRLRRLMLAGGLGLFALSSGLAWLLSRRIVRPLLAMRDAADRMARGEYAARVSLPGTDELSQLAQSIDRLSQALHRLETGRRSFFANVSHELRTPLSYVRGYAQALADGLVGDEDDVKKHGRIVAEEARRMGRLVDDLFELARADEGRLDIRCQTTSIKEAAERVAARLQAAAKEKGVDLILDAPDAVRVWADPDRLEQIVINLLENALRHTPSGGTIRLQARRSDDGDRVTVTVEDSGAGFAGAADRAWERFYRGDEARNSAQGGFGLGLAIVKTLVEAHGGAVFAGDSEALGGARVELTLLSADGKRGA